VRVLRLVFGGDGSPVMVGSIRDAVRVVTLTQDDNGEVAVTMVVGDPDTGLPVSVKGGLIEDVYRALQRLAAQGEDQHDGHDG